MEGEEWPGTGFEASQGFRQLHSLLLQALHSTDARARVPRAHLFKPETLHVFTPPHLTAPPLPPPLPCQRVSFSSLPAARPTSSVTLFLCCPSPWQVAARWSLQLDAGQAGFPGQ